MNKRISSYTILFILLIILIIFLGYIYFSDVEAISHVNADIESVNSINPKLTSADIIFTINITNPTSREIYDLSSSFDVYIDDTYIGEGSFSKTGIKPLSNIFHQTNLTVYYSGIADATIEIIKNWMKNKQSNLIIKGNMTAKTLFGLIETTQPYEAST
jgi:LEA14-like dessication related protein